LLKFFHRKYTSLVNIDVGTLLQIAQQKTAKTIEKYSKNIISDLPTLISSRYETGTTGSFLGLIMLLKFRNNILLSGVWVIVKIVLNSKDCF
jgi:hypothetical protein